MPQPTEYVPGYDFSEFQGANPTTPLPGDRLDTELNSIATSVGEIITNLGAIQRDDGDLGNATVGFDQLDADVRALFGLQDGVPRGPWVTATAYVIGDLVTQSGVSYACVVAHTSGTFATDLAANKWMSVTPVYTSFGASVLGAADASAAQTLLGISTFIKTLLDDADAPTAQTTLGISTFIKTLLDDVDAATARTTLGVVSADSLNSLTTDGTIGAHADLIPFVDASDSNASNKGTVSSLFSNAITNSTDTSPATPANMGEYEVMTRKISDGSLHKMLLSELGQLPPGAIVAGFATIDFASVADNATSAASTISISGLVAGDFVLGLSASGNIDTTAGVKLIGSVSGANTVSVYLHNDSGSAFDASSQTIYAVCLKKSAVGL
jgi:hypothetical protein